MGNGLCVETSSSWTVFDWLDKVLGSIGSYAGVTKSKSDDSFADRLSHHYTPIILIVFTIIVSTKQYAGDPIQCWCPAQYTDAHVEYAKMVCWVSNTYYIPMTEVIPKDIDKRDAEKIPYYQWVPIILLFMALMFKVPRIFWKAISAAVGLSIEKATNIVFRLEMAPEEKKEKIMNDLITYMDLWFRWRTHYNDNKYVRSSRLLAKYTCLCANRRHGNYFTTATIVTKVIYLANAVLQFFLLNLFLGANFASWGFHIISGQADDNFEYQENTVFPRVTLCDFELRQLQNIQRHTVQCVLSINLFNSRIFVFVWVWYVLLITISFFSLTTSFYALMVPFNRVQYIRKYLKLFYLINPEELPEWRSASESEEPVPEESTKLVDVPKMDADIRRFVKDYLKSRKNLLEKFVMEYLTFDGVVVLRLMARAGNEILTADVIRSLWERYENSYRDRGQRPNTDTRSKPCNGFTRN